MLIVLTKEGVGGGKKKKKNVVDHFRLSRAETRNMLNTSVFTQWVF